MGKVVGLTFKKVAASTENTVTKKDLLAKAKELGLAVDEKMTKADLEKLIKEAEDNAAASANAGDK